MNYLNIYESSIHFIIIIFSSRLCRKELGGTSIPKAGRAGLVPSESERKRKKGREGSRKEVWLGKGSLKAIGMDPARCFGAILNVSAS